MQAKKYSAGSIVYFAGDRADKIYILKEGEAQSIFISEETGLEDREPINVGEFFGVKSILSIYPQEDTVQCITNCIIIVISYEEFEALIEKNKQIIIKMLKVFSNQLRRINKKVNVFMGTEFSEDDTAILEGFYNIGEFYFKSKKFKSALYAYKRYFQYANENDSAYHTVQKKIEECKKELNITDDSNIAPASDIHKLASKYSSINNAEYNKAVDNYNASNYSVALASFNSLSKSQDNDVAEASIFYLAKCYYAMEKYKETIDIISSAMSKYSKSKYIKEAILFLGKANEMIGEKEKAKIYYKKVISISPDDNLSKEANIKLSQL